MISKVSSTACEYKHKNTTENSKGKKNARKLFVSFGVLRVA